MEECKISLILKDKFAFLKFTLHIKGEKNERTLMGRKY